MDVKIRCVIDEPFALGECPVWSAREQALYWADVLAPALHRYDPASGERRRWPMPAEIGSFALRERGGAVVALRSGLHLFAFDSGRLDFIAHPEAGLVDNRFNDGKASPDGRFFVGTMHDVKPREPRAALYRLDPDGGCHKMLDGLTVSNGLAWSPDGNTLYHSDSSAATIRAYDYDPADGSIARPRLVAEVADATGRPDGAATDVEGFYWSAGVSAGVLNRWSPDGRLDRRIALPVASPTMPCFGGPTLQTLYLTSLSAGRDDAVGPDGVRNGSLLALDVDVPGVAVGLFRG